MILTKVDLQRVVRHLHAAFRGTIYEYPVGADISYFEIVIGYVGAAATKSVLMGLVILADARPSSSTVRIDNVPF
jgi:hypothetical protein